MDAPIAARDPSGPGGAALAFRKLRRVAKRCLSGDFRYRRSIRCATERHGGYYGGMVVCPDGLDRSSVVYSFGLGGDLGFDLSLIRKYGLQVFGFDPTPPSIEWVRSQALPPNFHLQEYGLGAHDGTQRFNALWDPARRDGLTSLNYSSIHARRGDPGSVELPVRRLRTIMEQLGHARVDVVKIDIEGGEYAALEELLSGEPDVGQFLIDFHHRFPGVGRRRTDDAIRLLDRRGYRLFASSWVHYDGSFLRTGRE